MCAWGCLEGAWGRGCYFLCVPHLLSLWPLKFSKSLVSSNPQPGRDPFFCSHLDQLQDPELPAHSQGLHSSLCQTGPPKGRIHLWGAYPQLQGDQRASVLGGWGFSLAVPATPTPLCMRPRVSWGGKGSRARPRPPSGLLFWAHKC